MLKQMFHECVLRLRMHSIHTNDQCVTSGRNLIKQKVKTAVVKSRLHGKHRVHTLSAQKTSNGIDIHLFVFPFNAMCSIYNMTVEI